MTTIKGFVNKNRWAADNGELPTTLVDGYEVVDEPATIAEWAAAVERAVAREMSKRDGTPMQEGLW